jgi:hypothetical protein
VNGVRHALQAAVRKLALVRMLHAALATLTVAAGVWSLLVLLVGKSTPLFLVLSGAWIAAVVLHVVLAPTTTLDAARRVERLAAWQEKLSTAVELEAAGPTNPFYRRLHGEAEALLGETPAATAISWDLQRLAVVACVLIVVATSVTVLFPGGVFAMLEKSESSARRERAADILQTAADRLENASLDSPGVNEMRLELVGLLNDIRRDRAIRELQQEAALAEVKIDASAAKDLPAEAQVVARELGKSRALGDLAAAVAQLDAGNIPPSVQKVAETSPDLSSSERRSAVDALNAAGAASSLPGLSDPLKTAAQALAAADIERFQRAMREFGAELAQRTKRFEAERQAAEAARGALNRVRAVLSGKGDPGGEPPRAATQFFVEHASPSTEAHGTGNLLVRGKPGDIQQILEQSRTADVPLPDLRDVIRNEETLLERRPLTPECREYVRRYFTVESDNR